MRAEAVTRRCSARQVVLLSALLLSLGALAACAQSPGGQSSSLGTLDGDVTAGPTCPVETVTGQCPPQPVQNREVIVDTSSGAQVTAITTDSAGRFSVRLPAGNYVVKVKIVPGEVGVRQITPGTVTVQAGQTTSVHIELDTGIR